MTGWGFWYFGWFWVIVATGTFIWFEDNEPKNRIRHIAMATFIEMAIFSILSAFVIAITAPIK